MLLKDALNIAKQKLGIEYCAKHCSIRDECFLFWANDNTEDVAPVVHAKWKIEEPDWIMMCSNCGNCEEIFYPAMPSNYLYCPNCGAKMDKA